MLDSMLLPDDNNATTTDAEDFAFRADTAWQIAQQRIRLQQMRDANRYNLRHKGVTYEP